MVQYLPGALALVCIGGTVQAQVSKSDIGASRRGQPIPVYTIAHPGDRSPDERPALLVVAGVDPTHRVGVAAARALIGRDWSEQADILKTHTLYVVPELNPDGSAWLDGHAARVRTELSRTIAPFDADRDRRLAEDPPNDLNADGMITLMRVENPPARYALNANMVPDDDDPRLMRLADADKAERGRWAVLTEGVDDDNDGSFNEDGPGGPGSGVDLDRNFPTHWPEFDEGAGDRPLSEPESLAFVQWTQEHPNIVGVLILAPGDSMLNKPPTGQYDETGRIPKGIEKADQPAFDAVVEKYKQHVKLDSAPAPNYEGSLLSWAYADFGAWSFESAVWSRPKVEQKKDDDAPEQAESIEPAAPVAPSREDRKQVLLDQGVPDPIATFLTASLEERQAIASEFESAGEAERAQMMATIQQLSPEIQAQVMQAVQETAAGQAPQQPPAAPSSPQPSRQSRARGKSGSDDGKWLAYLDADRAGEGFIEWTRLDHPQLGTVEVGGFVPGIKLNPPDDQLDALADAEAAFVVDLLSMLPRIELAEPQVERLSNGIWRVSVELSNSGRLPTSSAAGRKIGQRIAIDINVDPDMVLSGRRVVTVDSIGAEPQRFEWLIRAEPGQDVEVTVRSDRFGRHVATATLDASTASSPTSSDIKEQP